MLFKYMSPLFQPANRIVTLAPAYLTHFDVHGNTATVYFQNHFFNVSPGTDGNPLWIAVGHQVFQGTARKVDGRWLFAQSEVTLTTQVPTP